MELCSMLRATLDGREGCETITTLLIGYAPIQNVFGVRNKNKIRKKVINIF